MKIYEAPIALQSTCNEHRHSHSILSKKKLKSHIIANQRNEQGFRPCFQRATALANLIDVVPVKHNGKTELQSKHIKSQWGLNLYPFIDHITITAIIAAYLVPKSLMKLTKDRQQIMIKWYHEDLPNPETAKQEIECWKNRFQSDDAVMPASALKTLFTLPASSYTCASGN